MSSGNVSQFECYNKHQEDVDCYKILSSRKESNKSIRKQDISTSEGDHQNFLSFLKEITRARPISGNTVYLNTDLIFTLPCKFLGPSGIASTTEQQFSFSVNDLFKLQRISSNAASYSAILAAGLLFIACSLAIPVLIRKILDVDGRIYFRIK